MKGMSVRNYLKIINRQAVCINRLITLSPEQFPQKSHGLLQGRILFCTDAQEIRDKSRLEVDDVRKKKSFFVRAYFSEYLKTDPAYKNLIYTPKVSVGKDSTTFLSPFQQYMNDLVLSSELSNISEDDLKQLSSDELLDVIYLTLKCSERRLHGSFWHSLIELLDKEVMCRSLQSKEILKCLHLIRDFPYVPHFTFYSSSLCKLLSKIKNLPKEQAVLLLYLFVKIGESKLKEKKFNLCCKILEIVPDLKLEELAIVFLGTSVISCKFQIPDIVPAILENIENNIDKLDSLLLKVLCNLPLTIMYKGRTVEEINETITAGLEEQNARKYTVLYNNFQEAMIPHVSKFHPSSLVCLLLINNVNNQINVTLAENVCKVVRENISLCSESILEKILCISSYYNIIDNELIDRAIKEFERTIEHFKTIQFQKCLLKFLTHLADIQIYPKNLLNYTMNPKFIADLISEHKTISITYWEFLNCCLKIEKPEYHCAITDEQIEKKLYKAKIYFPQITVRPVSNSYQSKQHSIFHSMCYSIENGLKEIYGDDKVLWFAPLRHHQEIILMIFDRDLKPHKIPENFRVVKSHEQKVIEPFDDDRFWVPFILASGINFVRRNNELTYNTQAKVRQFTKVGYKPILVIMNEFNAHKKNDNIGKYLTELVDENLKQLVGQKT